MNKRLFAFIACLAAACTSVAGADLAGLITVLPKDWAPWLAILPPLAAAFLHFLDIFGDYADDGKRNNSFNPTLKVLPLLMWLTLGVLALPLVSCSGLSLAVTPDGRVVGEYKLPPAKEQSAPPVVDPKPAK